MRTCICDSCVKQDKCPEQFMLRHVCNLMLVSIPGDTASGGPGDTPWTYKDWGMSVDVHCRRYEYAGEYPLSSCATHLGPHKLRLDFTKTTKERERYLYQKERARREALKTQERIKRNMAAQREADFMTYHTNLTAEEIHSITGKYPSWY